MRTRVLSGLGVCAVAVAIGCGAKKTDASPTPTPTPGPATPTPVDPATWTRVTISGDPGASGVFDPYPVADGADIWLAYSSVFYHSSGGNLVQDVTTNIGKSTDAGASWSFVQPVATPAINVSLTAANTSVCGTPQCTGHVISEVPVLIHDATDPDPAKRWKLFEHRYLLYPPLQASNQATQYATGAIYLQTASAPDATWTAGTPVLGWALSPPEIGAVTDIATIGTPTQPCIAISEPGGFATATGIDLVFSCIYQQGGSIVQKTVLLRSTDHAATFTAVSDLLLPADAALFGGSWFTGSSLVQVGGNPVLFATPIPGASGLYSGCASVGFSDFATGAIDRTGGDPNWRTWAPTAPGVFGGACAYDAASTATGALAIRLDLGGNPADPFRIYATHATP